jgi:hypothetical protein
MVIKVGIRETDGQVRALGAVHYAEGAVAHNGTDRVDGAGFSALVEAIVDLYCPGLAWTGPKVILAVAGHGPHDSATVREALGRFSDRLEVVSHEQTS